MTGSLLSAAVIVLPGLAPHCGNTGASESDLWYLPHHGAKGFDWSTYTTANWNITAAADVLPGSLSCAQKIQLGDVTVTGDGPVDLSAPSRSMAYGKGPADAAAIKEVLSYPHSGTATFKIDCGEYGGVSWSTPFMVLPASPPGREPGVSIDDGADFTNNPEVQLYFGWRGWDVDKVKVSNDGGFAPSRTRVSDLTSGDPLSWRLVVLGNERLPKTVYIRFHRAFGEWDDQIYTDDIVLDTVVPQILSLSFAPPGELTSARRAVRVRAKDNRSGIKSVQLSKGKPRKNAKVLTFRRTLPAPGSGRVFVRVRDGAGNWSKWKAVA